MLVTALYDVPDLVGQARVPDGLLAIDLGHPNDDRLVLEIIVHEIAAQIEGTEECNRLGPCLYFPPR
jgi:hypothetical protein